MLKVVERTGSELKISTRTVERVTSEYRRNGSLSKHQRHMSGRKKIEVDSFTEGVIRRAVMFSYANIIVPTLNMLHVELLSDAQFPGVSRSTLHRIMKNQLKFKFLKFHEKPVPMERFDVAAHRASYLRNIAKYRRQGYQVR